ncbi:hypothetical protein [uncultured Sphingomonas sp.]|uniref:hypothetical protein n=1 Tax=uncultured Sphingomonas sp. TaxID=158754 RepID=UPI0035CA2F48
MPRFPDAARADPAGFLWRWRALILLAVTLAARAATFGDPVVHVDEEFYLTVARAMARGALLYVDVWDRKPVGLFLLYMPVAWLPPAAAVLGYQLLASVFVWGTSLVAAALADRAGWQRGALIGAILTIVWLDLADGQGGQAPAFYDLFTAAAAWVTMRAGDADMGARQRVRLGLAAMLIVGCALQIKYSVVFEGAAFGLWLLWAEWRAARSVPSLLARGGAWIAAALLPTLMVLGFYAAIGRTQAFLYANFLSILQRGSDPWSEQARNGMIAIGILAPLVLLALAGVARAEDRETAHRRHFLYAWLAAAILGLAVFGSWFNHYTLPVMLPAGVCAAGAFARPGEWGRALRAVSLPLLVLTFAAGQTICLAERVHRGTRAEFAAVAQAVGRGPGSLYVYSGSPMLYTATDRPALTPYLMPAHLLLDRETGAIGVDQHAEVARVLARDPDTVVVQSWDDFERPDLRPMLLTTLARGRYVRVAVLPVGRNMLSVFRAPR